MSEESDKLRQQAAETDNDAKALRLLTKAIREDRSSKFEETWLPRFKATLQHVEKDEKKGCYTIVFIDDIYDFYPRANNVLHRNENRWHKPALKWLINKFKI